MSMLDVHEAALEEVNEGHHAFMLRYRADTNVVYGVVEGKDDPMFYRSMIERFLPEGWGVEFVLAGNKDKVLKTFEAIDWSAIPRRRVGFFVDRDLDVVLGEAEVVSDNIYVTDGYSIENDVVTPELAIRVLSEAYNVIDITVEEEQALRTAFNEDMQFFQDKLVPAMAQVCAWRKGRMRCYISDVDWSAVFAFEQGRIRLRDGFQTAEAVASHLVHAAGQFQVSDELRQWVEAFQAADGARRYTRGKYLLWFFYQATEAIHGAVARFSQAYSQPPRRKIQVGLANMMVVAAPRARCPASLRDFIERNFQAYAAA